MSKCNYENSIMVRLSFIMFQPLSKLEEHKVVPNKILKLFLVEFCESSSNEHVPHTQ